MVPMTSAMLAHYQNVAVSPSYWCNRVFATAGCLIYLATYFAIFFLFVILASFGSYAFGDASHYVESFAISLEKLVYEHRKYYVLWKCLFELSEHLILPCFSHSIERNEFLTYEPVTSVESAFCHEYMEMWVEAHTSGKRVQHNNSACSQSPVSVPV